MNSIDFDSLLITIFVLVDDWYQTEGRELKVRTPGRAPEMSDSEILTLIVLMDYLPFPGETQFLGFIRANYGEWFPELLAQSQFNRRLRQLGQMLEMLRRSWVRQLGATDALSLVMDTKPVPVVGYRRSKKRSDFYGSANYGYCAARKMKYFGYKLVMLSTLEGIPVAYDLVAANTDERQAVEGVLAIVNGCDIYGDKGFIGHEWQQAIAKETDNRIWTIHRCNQAHQKSPHFKRLIGRIRQRVEGVFHEIQNTGRNPERLLNKTVNGFATHITATELRSVQSFALGESKILASHTLRLLLRRQFGIDVQTFESVSSH